MKKRCGFLLIGLAVLFLSVPAAVWAQEEEPEEEEPVQTRPNPLEKTIKPVDRSQRTFQRKSTSRSMQNVQASIRSKLSAMGFKIGPMNRTGGNSWSVQVQGWNSTKASASLKGAISWDPTDRKNRTGAGTLMIEVDEDGFMTISRKSLSSMGLKANTAKLKSVANTH